MGRQTIAVQSYDDAELQFDARATLKTLKADVETYFLCRATGFSFLDFLTGC